MTKERAYEQLFSLIEDRYSFITDDYACEIFKEDIEAIETVIKMCENLQAENTKLKEEIRAVNRGLRKVISKCKKWKNRYYRERQKVKDLEKRK